MAKLMSDLLGYVAMASAICFMLPQLYRSLRTRSVDDLSWGMLWLYLANSILWLIYGASIGSWPLMTANYVTLVIGGLQLFFKVRYERSPKRWQVGAAWSAVERKAADRAGKS